MSLATISTKGHLIDPHCIYNDGKIYELNNFVYDCTLTLTDIATNMNNFYILQLIQYSNLYIIYRRNGIIGNIGEVSYLKFSNAGHAIKHFTNIMEDISGNQLIDDKKFIKKPNKYYLNKIERVNDVLNRYENICDKKIIEFIALITNNKIQNNLLQISILSNELPLGKIHESQVKKSTTCIKNNW